MGTIQAKDNAVAQPRRCTWARTSLSIAYHDLEWGVPIHDDNRLFEFLTLEGAQAGLSWETILRKREAYREAFVGFDPRLVAKFRPAQVARLLGNPGMQAVGMVNDHTVHCFRYEPVGQIPLAAPWSGGRERQNGEQPSVSR